MSESKFHIYVHGGINRRMLTIELGRHSKARGFNFTNAIGVLNYVVQWLRENGIGDLAPYSPAPRENEGVAKT